MATQRPRMRADARRNYERLLTEAHAVFTEHGADASLEDIAHRAGVGIGTLYRHFPTRQALLEALLGQRFAELRALAERLIVEEAAPAEALAAWLRALIAHAATYRGLAAALMATVEDEASELYRACEAAQHSGAALLTRAQDAGIARPGVSAEELFLLSGGIAWAAEQAPAEDRAQRLLDLALDGIWSRG